MKPRIRRFLAQPELVDDSLVRLLGAVLLVGGALFFFRQRAVPVLIGCAAGGGLVLALLWAGYRQLGVRPLGAFWPGTYQGPAIALLVFCVLPPGVPPVVAGLLAALAVGVEAVERRASVRVAVSGVTAAWVLGGLWQSRTGTPFIAPFDFHVLDEPITLWVRFATAIEPVRLYAGQAAGPLGATSFGLVAIVTLMLSFSRSLSWHALAAFYAPVAGLCLVARLPLNVYLLDGPGLVFAAVILSDSRRLPRTVTWRLIAGLVAGLVAALMLGAGSGYEAFGIGVAVSTVLLSVFQVFGLAGSPAVAPPASADGRDTRVEHVVLPVPARPSALQVVALTAFLPAGLVIVWRDGTLARSQRAALVLTGMVLYVTAVAGSLTWLWVLRLPG